MNWAETVIDYKVTKNVSIGKKKPLEIKGETSYIISLNKYYN